MYFIILCRTFSDLKAVNKKGDSYSRQEACSSSQAAYIILRGNKANIFIRIFSIVGPPLHLNPAGQTDKGILKEIHICTQTDLTTNR
jgi:hypothetical protein